jgi:hypothetical protein
MGEVNGYVKSSIITMKSMKFMKNKKEFIVISTSCPSCSSWFNKATTI